jgi:Methyltransferase domain
VKLKHKGEVTGWRGRAIAGGLRLRPPIANHTPAEGRLIERGARGAHVAVEIGVDEGGSAYKIRQVMDPSGRLVLIDPFPGGRVLGISFARRVARRVVGSVPRGNVTWVRMTSTEAARDWQGRIDFLYIDGIHTRDGVRADWRDWSPHVVTGGRVIVRQDVLQGRALEALGTSQEAWAPTEAVGSLLLLARRS